MLSKICCSARRNSSVSNLATLTRAVIVLAITAGAQTLLADDLIVERNAQSGAVAFIRGANGGPLPLAPAANAVLVPNAIDALKSYGHHFGISDPSTQLIQTRVESDPLGWTHTTLEQRHLGVPVFSGVLKVHQNAAGELMSINGRYYAISPKLSVTPEIDASMAEQIAAGTIDSLTKIVDRSELVVVDPGWYGDPGMGPKLAYHVIITNADVSLREAFFVDAHCGEILDQWSMIHTAKDRDIYDGNAAPSIPGTLARSEGDPSVPIPADVDRAYDYYGDTYDFYLRAFGRDSIDGAGLTMVATVNSTAPNCPNAYWNGVQMVFCDGLVTDDVVGHELTHGVTQYTAGLIYQNQSGQLNESYSDVFGELIDLYNGDAAFAGAPGGTPWLAHPTGSGLDTPNNLRGAGCSLRPDGYPDGVRWLIGEDVLAISNIIRDMWNPPCRNHPDFANSTLQTCAANDSGGVHSGSGVANHAFAIATDGKTFNGYTVTGVGPIKAGAVWYRALTVYLTPASDFSDAFFALRLAALDLVGFDPSDPRTGLPSGSSITGSDAAEIEEALLAVEMNTDGSCGGNDTILSGDAPVVCGNQTVIFADNFEGGVNGWTVSNSNPITPYDWEQSAALPQGRTGTAWFCPDPSIGNCGSQDESGFHSLFSPTIVIPVGATAPFVSFTHLIGTEGGFDAGNLKIDINGGGATLIPRAAFAFNAYNGILNDISEGNTNPQAGEESWSGSGASWGTSVIDLRGIAAPGDSIQFRFDLSKDGCTGIIGWYVDDFSVYNCGDCDDSGAPDIDSYFYSAASPILGGVGAGVPQSHTFTSPPIAASDVILTFNARGDFSSATENCTITVNGTDVGTVFATTLETALVVPNIRPLPSLRRRGMQPWPAAMHLCS
ncbi:MAG: M4 family metallopeptidase [Planctomycetes bacterium]|nr:M4 family metallopeptidase [Planctomycetota bacterium]